jgi:hypothetical protein
MIKDLRNSKRKLKENPKIPLEKAINHINE